MSPYESASLWSQWITTAAAVGAVIVAAVFGYLTLKNSRASKDTQDRATYAAASSSEPLPADFADAVKAVGEVSWDVSHVGGENFSLRHTGSISARSVSVYGLTQSDKDRLVAPRNIGDLGPTQSVEFVFRSRFTRSGPGNIVVSFITETSRGQPITRVVRVPAA